MPSHANKRSAHLQVIPATREQQPVLANLLELYAHDFSEFHNLVLGPDGRFGYLPLPLYWREPGRHPFLVTLDGQLAGFVLVKQGSEISRNETVWDVAEFFVVRAYRRRGIGTEIAHQVWSKFPGPWEVRVLQSNRSACHFWQQAVTAFTRGAISPSPVEPEPIKPLPVQKNGEAWLLYSFDSPRAS